MKIVRLLLTNVRCYDNLDVSFLHTDEKGEEGIRMRTIILGNNGTGKSTILKSIALLLCGSSALGELLGKPNDWIKKGTESCKIEAELQTLAGEERKVSLEISLDDNLTKLITRNKESLKLLDDALEHTDRNYLNIGYGVHRKIGTSNFNNENNFSDSRANNVATLFDSNASLHPLESWLMELDYLKGEEGLATIKSTLDKLLPDTTFEGIDKEAKSVKFKNTDGLLDFKQLSDGFQITANWLGDLLYRITNTYKDLRNPLNSSFILLIDEVALHIHPAWQRTIIQSIANIFPNAQIIATTHSPFVAQQAGDSELFTIIRKEDNQLDLFHYENDPRKLLIHQIILSDIFGLPTDESLAVEQAKNKIRKKGLSGIISTPNLVDTGLTDLKGVDSLKDIPINHYSYEKEGYLKEVIDGETEDPLALIKADLKRLRNKNESTKS